MGRGPAGRERLIDKRFPPFTGVFCRLGDAGIYAVRMAAMKRLLPRRRTVAATQMGVDRFGIASPHYAASLDIVRDNFSIR